MEDIIYDPIKQEDSDRSNTVQKRWSLLRNVFRAVHLFKTQEALSRSNLDDLVRELQSIPSDLHYRSQKNQQVQKSPFTIALEDHRREQRIFEYIERGRNDDLQKIIIEIEQDPYRYLRQATHPQSIINKPGKDGKTPLYCACINGNLDVVKILHEKGVDHLIESDVYGEKDTALEAASRWGYLQIVEFLIKHFEWPDQIVEKAIETTQHQEIQKMLRRIKRKKFLCCFC